jgi:hypothetical protein
MRHGITIIDHPVIGARDMPAARAAYERLGFVVPPRGSHPQWGTGNWCIMFERDYLEIRGVVDPAKAPSGAHGLMGFLEKREGLMGVAFGTVRAQTSHDLLAASGLKPKPVMPLTRNFELPTGTVPVSFALCFLDAAVTPGLMLVVICEHLTPERLRRPEWLRHPNGARGIRGLYSIVENAAALAPAHERLFGSESVKRIPEETRIEFDDGGFISLLEERTFARRFPSLPLPSRAEWPCLAAVSLATESPEATADFFSLHRIDHQADGARVLVPPTESCGVPIEFIRR